METSDIIWLQTRYEREKVNLRQILYCVVSKRYTDLYIHPKGKIEQVCHSLCEMENLLPRELFRRCSRTILVNIHFVKQYSTSRLELTLENGHKIHISRYHRKDFDDLFDAA